MPQAITKAKLSASTNGLGILVAATATPGTAIHTAVNSTSSYDEVWIYATNTTTTAKKLTIEFGGTAAANQIEYTIPAESGMHLIIPGLLLNNLKPIAAFAETTNVINIHGFVNAIV